MTKPNQEAMSTLNEINKLRKENEKLRMACDIALNAFYVSYNNQTIPNHEHLIALFKYALSSHSETKKPEPRVLRCAFGDFEEPPMPKPPECPPLKEEENDNSAATFNINDLEKIERHFGSMAFNERMSAKAAPTMFLKCQMDARSEVYEECAKYIRNAVKEAKK
jgi:hypothetical protein